MKNNYKIYIGAISFICFSLLFGLPTSSSAQKKFKNNAWQLVTDDAGWEKRAGLQVVRLNNNLYVIGGRTPKDSPIPGDSQIWGDVWKSNLSGEKWTKILSTEDNVYWKPRAYFSALTKGNYMYIIGGQNFGIFPPSEFFNDVWRSKDGISWQQMTTNAPWEGRAGLSAVVFKNEIYVIGGSRNDDDAVGSGEAPAREYYNDIWKSKDGKDWVPVTLDAPWEKRAGMRVVVKNGYLYTMGGENGFVSAPGLAPPYYNDVWRSKDGKNWKKIVAEAPWSARPGHEVLVYQNHFVLFGGFNLDPNFNPDPGPDFNPIPGTPGYNPYPGPDFSAEAANPMDIWISKDGIKWVQTPGAPWDAATPEEIKYDFDAIVVPGTKKNSLPAIITVGGDRETFNFFDPFNYLNVDNDVWRFYPVTNYKHGAEKKENKLVKLFNKAYPSPFSHDCNFEYEIPEEGHVSIRIYNLNGHLVKSLCNKKVQKGMLYLNWDGYDKNGRRIKEGMYYVKMGYKDKTEVNIVVKK